MLRFNISIDDIGRDVLINSTIKKYHFSDTDEKALSDIYGEIVEKCKPYAIYS